MNKNRRSILSYVRSGFYVVTVVSLMAAAGMAQTRQLPISVFLDQLGATDAPAWSDPASGNFVVFDAYGKRNTARNLNLGTTVEGSVSVILRSDDTQSVVVQLRTRNALCYGFNARFEPAFGYSAVDILNNVGPASLGSGVTRYVYSPQPIGPIDFNGPLDNQMTTLRCNGQLRAGSGYSEGLPGFAQTTQTGLFSTGVPGGCPLEHDADCFPAEKVQFKPTGN